MCGRFALRVNVRLPLSYHPLLLSPFPLFPHHLPPTNPPHRDKKIQHIRGYDHDHDINLEIPEWRDEDDFYPRYNIAPRTNVPVIRRRDPQVDGIGPVELTTASEADTASDTAAASASGSTNADADTQAGSGSDAPHPQPQPQPQPTNSKPKPKPTQNLNLDLIIQTMKWGLVPSWSKTENLSLNTINARSENVIDGTGMWEGVRGKKRCAIPCQGYYEWLTKGKDVKLPYFTKRKDGNLLLMAGLYDVAYIDGKPLWTFTIVTTEATPQFTFLHERQPVFLTTQDSLYKWLDTSSGQWSIELTKIVQPYHNPLVPLECYPVPVEVGKVGRESPTFIEPIKQRKDGIEAMFMRMGQKQSSTSAPSTSTSTSSASASTSSSSSSTPGPEPKNPAKHSPRTPPPRQSPTSSTDTDTPMDTDTDMLSTPKSKSKPKSESKAKAKDEPTTPTMSSRFFASIPSESMSITLKKSPQKRTAPSSSGSRSSSPSTPTQTPRTVKRVRVKVEPGEEGEVEVEVEVKMRSEEKKQEKEKEKEEKVKVKEEKEPAEKASIKSEQKAPNFNPNPPTTPKKPSSSRKLPPTPASSSSTPRRKRAKAKGIEAPPGNTKIDSFFKRASES